MHDEKTTGSDGGSATSGSWLTRVLNTVKTNEIASASLSSNRINLPAGTYYIEARAPFYSTGFSTIRLQNITDGTTLLTGTTESAGAQPLRSYMSGRFTVAGTKALEIQYRVFSSQSTNGLGVSGGLTTELYTTVSLWKIT